MGILATAQNTQPDYVALAMVLVLAVIIGIMAIRKKVTSGRKEEAVVTAPVQKAAVPQPEALGTAGQVKLNGVEPKTAAILMAIVADKMNKPLNELRFVSIKEVQ